MNLLFVILLAFIADIICDNYKASLLRIWFLASPYRVEHKLFWGQQIEWKIWGKPVREGGTGMDRWHPTLA